MNENQTWHNMGQKVRGAVEDALKTGDFSQLDDVLSDTVTDALTNVREQVFNREWCKTNPAQNAHHNRQNASQQNWQNTSQQNQQSTPWQNWQNTQQQNRQGTPQQDWQRAPQNRQYTRYGGNILQQEPLKNTLIPFKKVGRVSGTLYQVFGGIGTGITAILSLIFLGLAIGLGGGFRVNFCVYAILMIGFIVMINVGCGQKRRLKRAEKYKELSGHAHYINLEDLALHTGKTLKYVVKDVKRILKGGFFPEGHLDKQETCLMLDDKIYEEYLMLEKQRKVQEMEQQAEKDREEKEKQQSTKKSGRQERQQAAKAHAEQGKRTENDADEEAGASAGELQNIIEEGQDCIRKLREMNEHIPGEMISAKLFKLENILKEIFRALEEHPDQIPQMQKFMNYYLPTTIKLVDAYEEFDSLSVQSEDIQEAKAEIEKTLDTINDAFGELLNKLFRETAYDVTTDAQVLQTMLAKEGLAGGGILEKERDLQGIS